jgi:hypothetical protein
MENEKKVIEIDIEIEAAIKDAAEMKKNIDSLRESTKKLKAEVGESDAEYIKASAELKVAQKEYNTLNGIIEKNIAANKENAGILPKLEAANAKLRAEVRKYSDETDEGKKKIAEINKQIDENTKRIKENSDKQKGAWASVGQYTEGILGAVGQLPGGFAAASKGAQGLGAAGKVGFGWISVIIGFVTLIADQLKKMQPIMDSISKVGEGLTQVFNVLFKRLIMLGKALVDIFTFNAKAGLEGLKKSFAGLGEEISNAYNAGVKFRQMEIDLEKATIANIKALQELEAKERELTLAVDDNTTSLKSHKAAEAELIKIKQQRLEIALDIAKKELDIANEAVENEKRKGFEVNREALKNQAEKLAAFKNAEEDIQMASLESAKKQREIKQDQLMRELDFIIDDYDTKKTINEKNIADTKKGFDERFALLEENKKLGEKAFNDEISAIEKSTGKKIDAQKLINAGSQEELNNMVKNAGVSDTVAGSLLTIMKERRIKLAENAEAERALLSEKAAFELNVMAQELEQFKINNKTKLDGTVAYTEESVKAEQERLLLIQQEQEKYFAAQLEAEPQKAAEIATARLQSEAEYQQQLVDLKQTFKDQEAERNAVDLQNEFEIQSNNIIGQLQLKEEELKQKREAELKYAEKIGADKEKIIKKYNKAEFELERAKINAKLALAGGFTQNLATIFGEQTSIGKSAAVASATISALLSANEAFASLAGIPVVGPVLGAVAAAAALAAGYANVDKIINTKSGLPEKGVASSKPSGGGGGGASATPTIQRNITAGGVNEGIISREVLQASAPVIDLQPTLVIDDATAKATQQSSNKKTAVI